MDRVLKTCATWSCLKSEPLRSILASPGLDLHYLKIKQFIFFQGRSVKDASGDVDLLAVLGWKRHVN